MLGGNLALCRRLSHLYVAELVKAATPRNTRANLKDEQYVITHCTKHVNFELPSTVLERLIMQTMILPTYELAA